MMKKRRMTSKMKVSKILRGSMVMHNSLLLGRRLILKKKKILTKDSFSIGKVKIDKFVFSFYFKKGCNINLNWLEVAQGSKICYISKID